MEVDLTIIKASGLEAADLNGLSDPYIKFLANNKKYETKVKENTLNPFWNKTFKVTLNEGDEIKFKIFDHDTIGKDDKIGTVTYKVPSLIQDEIKYEILNINKKGVLTISLFCKSNGKKKEPKEFDINKPMLMKLSNFALNLFDDGEGIIQKGLYDYSIEIKSELTQKQSTQRQSPKYRIFFDDELYFYGKLGEEIEIKSIQHNSIKKSEEVVGETKFKIIDFKENEQFRVAHAKGSGRMADFTCTCIDSIYSNILPNQITINPRKLFRIHLSTVFFDKKKYGDNVKFYYVITNKTTNFEYKSETKTREELSQLDEDLNMMMKLDDQITFEMHKIDENQVETVYMKNDLPVSDYEINIDYFQFNLKNEEEDTSACVYFYRSFEVSEELKKKFNLQ